MWVVPQGNATASVGRWVTEQSRGGKPVSYIPLGPLLQIVSPGSFLALEDGLKAVNMNKPFLRVGFGSVFYHSNRRKTGTITKNYTKQLVVVSQIWIEGGVYGGCFHYYRILGLSRHTQLKMVEKFIRTVST